jgi:hypothetical protein
MPDAFGEEDRAFKRLIFWALCQNELRSNPLPPTSMSSASGPFFV